MIKLAYIMFTKILINNLFIFRLAISHFQVGIKVVFD